MAVTKRPIVVGIGELLWDMLPGGKRAGGAPVNFVYHASQLGAQGYAVSAVGKDPLGDEILQVLRENHIEGIIARVDYPTGTVQVKLHNGIPSYTIVENVAWDHIPFTPQAAEVARQADAVCFGTLALRHPDSYAAVKKLLEQVPAESMRFFDINLRQSFYSKELIEDLLKSANVFKINDDELVVLRQLFGLQGTDEQICRELLKTYNLRYVIFTAGEKYSIIYAPDAVSRLDTPHVSVADTVGAGDSFSGAFVAAVLAGENLYQAHEVAVKTAAFVCTKPGAWPSYN